MTSPIFVLFFKINENNLYLFSKIYLFLNYFKKQL